MAGSFRRDVTLLVTFAFFMRIGGIALTTLTRMNTYARADVAQFSERAHFVASLLADGSLPSLVLSSPTNVWGAMLSPFWLLPGPSRIYARIGVAILACIAVYNVYVLGRFLHSRPAGIFAAVPIAVYPSFVLVHSTVLREAFVLFALTTAARVVLVPSEQLSHPGRYGVAVVAIALGTAVRIENAPVYLLLFAIGVTIATEPWRRAPNVTRAFAVLATTIGAIGLIALAPRIVDRLSTIREKRARGRTAYLSEIVPDTLPELVAFSWLGAVYFLFAPFPWMVDTIRDFVVLGEALTNVIFAVFAVSGTRVLAQRTLGGTVVLVIGVILGSVLYGIANANVGTVVRQRQMVLWAIFLLGGIGIAHHVDWRTMTER